MGTENVRLGNRFIQRWHKRHDLTNNGDILDAELRRGNFDGTPCTMRISLLGYVCVAVETKMGCFCGQQFS